jgi:hypothetical protein
LPTGFFDKFFGESSKTIQKVNYGTKKQTMIASFFMVAIIIMSFWNNWHNTYNYNAPGLGKQTKTIMPPSLEKMVNVMRIDQRWWMFTLENWTDFWLDMNGKDENGESVIDPFAWHLGLKDSSFNTAKPQNYRKDLGTQLWNRYMYDLKDRKITQEWFLYTLCEKYNAKNPDNKLSEITLHQTTEKIEGFNKRSEPTTRELLTWECDE